MNERTFSSGSVAHKTDKQTHEQTEFTQPRVDTSHCVNKILTQCDENSFFFLGGGTYEKPKSTKLSYPFDGIGVGYHVKKFRECHLNRRPYNLYCVGADVKPCSIQCHLNDRGN